MNDLSIPSPDLSPAPGWLAPHHPCSSAQCLASSRRSRSPIIRKKIREENEITLAEGECVLLYSDGIAEAHNPARHMLGFERLRDWVAAMGCGDRLIPTLMRQLDEFTGPAWEQEDDITMVVLERLPASATDTPVMAAPQQAMRRSGTHNRGCAHISFAHRAIAKPGHRMKKYRCASPIAAGDG